ncbi:MAG: 2-C-methyl-D-erythritol 4-phosphate cytidylyltransferase [Phycisphaerales bacterium]|nr:2-C-methyl-D-erythritol 4-phosphate cytidylyltransferase [Phycisphaerales bacterium]
MPATNPSRLRIAAIICAAGSGTRFGSDHGSKLDADLHGEPVLYRATQALSSRPEVVTTIVAGPADAEALAEFRRRHEAQLDILGAAICAGGPTERYETVQAALRYTLEHYERPDAVLVHDAARPCTSDAVVYAVINGLGNHAAVVPAVPVADTLKRVEAGSDPRAVLETVDRRGLFSCQTPQGFRTDLLERAYMQSNLVSTDDAQLIERLGEPVALVPGDPRNLKITRPHDLDIARAVWPTLRPLG